MTEADEFQEIYKLDVVVPTNQPMVRDDDPDLVYRTEREKYNAIVAEIKDCHEKRPAGPGRHHLDREVRSCFRPCWRRRAAPGPQRQAARDGGRDRRPGRAAKVVTIATNMAGRGTDIVLGGKVERRVDALTLVAVPSRRSVASALREEWQQLHAEVIAAGGLHIIGTERHESRRIDNQLRGRAGRQGDPGSSRFYLSLEDPLLRIFAGDASEGDHAAAENAGGRGNRKHLG